MTLLGHNIYMSDNVEKVLIRFSNKLKDIMAEKGWSIKQFAEQIDIPRTTLNSWVLMKKVPKLDLLDKIADCLGVTIDYLVGRED